MAAFGRTKLVFALIPFYGIFALIINSMIMGDENLIIWLYVVIVANRIISGYQVKTKRRNGEKFILFCTISFKFYAMPFFRHDFSIFSPLWWINTRIFRQY